MPQVEDGKSPWLVERNYLGAWPLQPADPRPRPLRCPLASPRAGCPLCATHGGAPLHPLIPSPLHVRPSTPPFTAPTRPSPPLPPRFRMAARPPGRVAQPCGRAHPRRAGAAALLPRECSAAGAGDAGPGRRCVRAAAGALAPPASRAVRRLSPLNTRASLLQNQKAAWASTTIPCSAAPRSSSGGCGGFLCAPSCAAICTSTLFCSTRTRYGPRADRGGGLASGRCWASLSRPCAHAHAHLPPL